MVAVNFKLIPTILKKISIHYKNVLVFWANCCWDKSVKTD